MALVTAGKANNCQVNKAKVNKFVKKLKTPIRKATTEKKKAATEKNIAQEIYQHTCEFVRKNSLSAK